MTAPKLMHYRTARTPWTNFLAWSACGFRVIDEHLTDDWELVTCKSCLRCRPKSPEKKVDTPDGV